LWIDDIIWWNSCSYLMCNIGYVAFCGIEVFICSSSCLRFEINCFDDFCLIMWKSWILWMIIVQICFKSLNIQLFVFVFVCSGLNIYCDWFVCLFMMSSWSGISLECCIQTLYVKFSLRLDSKLAWYMLCYFYFMAF